MRSRSTRACLVLGAALALMISAAWGYWSPNPGSGGAGASSAATISQEDTPTALAEGSNVTVSWAASTIIEGSPVTGYVIKRFDAKTLALQSIATACAGTVTTTSCTENTVPVGQWRYSVTPSFGTYWTGSESPMSSAVSVAYETSLDLGAAGPFSALGGTEVSSSGATVVSGDLGVSPLTSVVGFPPGLVGGTIHTGDAAAATAQSASAAAYNDAAARNPTQATIAGELGGVTFNSGVHHAVDAADVSGTVTLDALGDPNAVFIFQLDAGLTTGAPSQVILTNGAQPDRVFWQVNGGVEIGAGSSFTGTIFASGAIAIDAGAQLVGRALCYGVLALAGDSISFSAAARPVVAIIGGGTAATWDTTPTLAGTTDAAAGTPVTVQIDGQTLTTAVLADLTWTVTAAELARGTYGVVASVRNPAGDVGWAQQQLTVQVNPLLPSLATAAPFSVLAATGVTSTGATTVSGDVGVSPSSSVVGLTPGNVAGSIHLADATAASAQDASGAAYNDVAARAPSDSFPGAMGGLTFYDGVHHSDAAATLAGTVTLDAQGDPRAVFDFQLSAALSTAAGSRVVLANGAQASNVFWQVNGDVGTGASSFFVGTIMAKGAITLGAGGQLLGRALSDGTVTLSGNTIRFTEALPPVVTIDGGAAARVTTDTPTVTGSSDVGVGAAVTVRVAGQTLPTTVQTDGTWSVTTATLSGGAHDVVASVKDEAGNYGSAAQTLTVELNPTPGPTLGLAGPFSVLGGTGVASTGATVVSGDLGVSPSTSVTGFPPGSVAGDIHAGDSAAASAQSALVAAYDDCVSRTPTDSIAGGALGGVTFDDGVHHVAGPATLTGTVMLDGRDDPKASFIFQLDGGLSTAAASKVELINGAQASNVFWQIKGVAGTGASSTFAGTIMATGAITLGAGTTLTGRALGYSTVTLSANPVSFSSGAAPTMTITGGPFATTPDTTPLLAGTTDATPGTTVTVRINGQTLTTTVASDGSWNVTAAALLAGNYAVGALVRNAAGDAGTASQFLTVEVNPDPVPLAAAGSYSVLSGASVTSTGSTRLSGDVGVSPGMSIAGFPPGTLGGTQHAGDAAAASAKSALDTAYDDVANRAPSDSFAGEIGGRTFDNGIHHAAAAISLTGTVTLDARGDPNAVFIFQVSGPMNTAAASLVNLANGAQPSNVYWLIDGAFGAGAGAAFTGTLLVSGGITLGAGAALTGRALAFGFVTLANNAVSFSTGPAPTMTITGGASVTTSDPTPLLAGTTDAPPGTTVTVRINGQTLTTTVAGDGSWNVTAAALLAGTYPVVALVRNAAGDAGSASQSLTVEVNPDPVALGAAGSYSVLSGAGVTNTLATALSGDLGVSTGTIVGFPPGTVGGTQHAGDAAAITAKSALDTAYNDVANRAPSDSFAGEIGGMTFKNGIHHAAAAIGLTGTVTLDARGDPNAVFIFQVNGPMTEAAAGQVNLINGAQASNVYWQFNGAFGAGAGAAFTGTLLVSGAITLGAGAALTGRALGYGIVTLANNAVS